MDQTKATPIALFNYAHSYAQSAVTLEENQTDATHWNAPINFLYFHAIELYLKAMLVSLGHDLEALRKQYGHKVKPLAEMCQGEGLHLSPDAEDIIDLMADTDNVITSRYIRLGTHQRMPLDEYFKMCQSLHKQISHRVYDGSGVTRVPTLVRNQRDTKETKPA